MARKKTKSVVKSKGKKTAVKTKRQAKMGGLALADSIEKDFLHVPAKLAAIYKKDLGAAKQQETKLKADLKKAEAINKIIKQKCDILTGKTTATAKKQLAAAKKTFVNSNKFISHLVAEIAKASKLSQLLAHKHAKYTTLGKELAKLSKQLDAKPVKAAAPKTKARKKSVKATEAPAEIISDEIEMEAEPIAPGEEAVTTNDFETEIVD
ncbi:MAG: hypothetical protein ACYCQI_05975 [Gammaproteobacteria bacterium]